MNSAALRGANLNEAHLRGADLWWADLQGASLIRTDLHGADLRNADLEGANLSGTDLTGRVDLRGATCDVKTRLGQALLDASIQVADVAWNGVSLIRIDWEQVPRLGDEDKAHRAQTNEVQRMPFETPSGSPIFLRNEAKKSTDQWIEGYEAAARAYRQLAIVLRGQGITEAADRFTYRALIMQRKSLWWHLRNRKLGKLGAYLFSLFLAVLTGYGFRLGRIILAYTLIILTFAGAYWSLDLQTPHIYTFWQALILSVTAFHGRVFSNPFTLTEPQIVVTAIEAIVGLVIEGVFIAMLTQRFFNR